MTPFEYVRAADTGAALSAASSTALPSRYLAGGTNLIDLMREGVERPRRVIDIGDLPLGAITELSDGGLRIGALVTNTAVASHALVRARFPVLSSAILQGASAQIRNMATTGGNLMQRTRCYYFYDTAARCNKRTPGTGCDALGGFNRIHAVLGASPSCIATHPSDMCVALAALDATVNVQQGSHSRVIPFAEFHRLPGGTPERDHTLEPGELITSVDVPGASADLRSMYRKVRDRASYAFALVSVAAALRVEDGMITDIRLALGGVAHMPWRATMAEGVLRGTAPSRQMFGRAAAAEFEAAVPHAHNAFKITLAQRTIVGVLSELTGLAGDAR